MSIQIKTEEVTKVVEKKMTIGYYEYWSGSKYTNISKDGQKREVCVGAGMKVLHYTPSIRKTNLGWGCHSVKPSEFKKILKNLKTGKSFQFKRKGDDDLCSISLSSLVKVVRIYSYGSVNKAELIEKMEILLKAHTFLYRK